MSLKALEVVERVSMTDEALCEEASKYVETLSFSVGVRELSSSTSSRFGRVVLKGGLSVDWPPEMTEMSKSR